MLPQPEVFIQNKEGLFSADGQIGNEGTQKFLQGFVAIFRQHDKQGLVDEAAFRQIALAVDPAKDEAALLALLERVDPHAHQQITFSDCVAALSGELVTMLQRE